MGAASDERLRMVRVVEQKGSKSLHGGGCVKLGEEKGDGGLLVIFPFLKWTGGIPPIPGMGHKKTVLNVGRSRVGNVYGEDVRRVRDNVVYWKTKRKIKSDLQCAFKLSRCLCKLVTQ